MGWTNNFRKSPDHSKHLQFHNCWGDHASGNTQHLRNHFVLFLNLQKFLKTYFHVVFMDCWAWTDEKSCIFLPFKIKSARQNAQEVKRPEYFMKPLHTGKCILHWYLKIICWVAAGKLTMSKIRHIAQMTCLSTKNMMPVLHSQSLTRTLVKVRCLGWVD